MRRKQVESMLIAIVIGAMTCFAGPVAAEDRMPDLQTIRDAYVYLMGRALVVRQEHTDIKEPGVD